MCLLTYFLSKIIGTTKKGIRRVFGDFYEASLFDCCGSILVNLSPGEYKPWNGQEQGLGRENSKVYFVCISKYVLRIK